MSGKLAKLAVLADMIKDAELARLSTAEAARRAAAAQSLSVQSARSAAIGQAETDAAHISGSAARWQIWAEQRLKTLKMQEAMAAAQAEAQKRVAARAFGRASTLARLSRQRGKS